MFHKPGGKENILRLRSPVWPWTNSVNISTFRAYPGDPVSTPVCDGGRPDGHKVPPSPKGSFVYKKEESRNQ